MNTPRPDRALARRLDPGLIGEACAERMLLLRENLSNPTTGQSPDAGSLDHIVTLLRDGRMTARSALKQYQGATDSGRWPILIVRPATATVEEAGHLLSEEGFVLDDALKPAYAEVGLLPVRVPPEAVFVEVLAGMACVDRAERSWMRGTLPQASHRPDSRAVTHPDHIVNRELLPSELVSKRDPLRVGLIDSGIDATHPALKTRLLDQRTFRRGLTGIGDQIGHGTAVAGVIARLCAAATFISAKIMDNKRPPNLDDVVRALGWLKRHRPDVLVCNILFPVEPDGRSIVSTLLSEFVRAGVLVLIPARDASGELQAPADAQRVVSICTEEAPATCRATLRARGVPILAPRSIQADNDAFPTLDVPKWTALSGPAAATAVTAGVATMMIRSARLCRIHPSPRDIVDAVLDTYDVASPGAIDPDAVLNLYINRVTTTSMATQTGRLALGAIREALALEDQATVANLTIPMEQPTVEMGEDELSTMPITADHLRAFRQHDSSTRPMDLHHLAQGAMPTAPYQRPSSLEPPTVQGSIPRELTDADGKTRPMDVQQLAQMRAVQTVDGKEHPPMLDLSRRGETEDTRRELAAESWPDNTQSLTIIKRLGE